MRRVKIIVYLGLLFFSLGILTGSLLAGDNTINNQANWDKLKRLSAGQEIQVVQNDAKSNRGSFRSVSDEAIVVNLATGEQTISRQSILRISFKKQGHRKRNALIGAGIGAGAGAGLGAGIDASCNCNKGFFPANTGIYVLTPVGAIAGGIVGAVIPSGGWHEVYRAR